MSNPVTIKTELRFVDIPWTWARLRGEYFGHDRSMETFVEECRHSLCFSAWIRDGLGDGFDQPIGFARVISDYVSFSQVSDFFIAQEFRGAGFSRDLFNAIRTDARLKTTTLNLFSRTPAYWQNLGFIEQTHLMLRPAP